MPFTGLVFGFRMWKCVRSHLQLRATRAADVACEDDSLGLGMSLKESEFVGNMMDLAAQHTAGEVGAEAAMVKAVEDKVRSPSGRRTSSRSPGGHRRSSANSSVSPALLGRHTTAAVPASHHVMNPKFATLAAIADLFRVEPKHIRYPLRLDPDLVSHFPMTEGAGTRVHDQVLQRLKKVAAGHMEPIVKREGVLYGAAWTLNLETHNDRSKVIAVATRFDTLMRQFDRLQSSTRYVTSLPMSRGCHMIC